MEEDLDRRVYPRLEVLELSGNAYKRGKKYGQKCKTMIGRQISFLYSRAKRKKNWSKEKLLREAKKYLPFVEGYSPEIADEMRGLADGAKVKYEEIARAHANHFTKLKVAKDLILEEAPKSGMSTLIRHNRINKLLSQKCGSIDLKTSMEMLKDHVNYPNSICCHSRDSRGKVTGMTFNSVVMLPAKREMYVAHGNPCRNTFYSYKV